MAFTSHYFRHLDETADAQHLLDPGAQVSTPWGEPDHGPCDKCDERGSVPYRCLSCMEGGSKSDCPACTGRVEWLDVCPTCAGTTRIVGTRRQGVSVFPTIGGLYRYLVERDADLDGSVIVELEGKLSDEPDLDADSGALLIHPTRVVTRHPVDSERMEDIRRRLEREDGSSV